MALVGSYDCSICNESFISKGKLIHHKRSVHQDKVILRNGADECVIHRQTDNLFHCVCGNHYTPHPSVVRRHIQCFMSSTPTPVLPDILSDIVADYTPVESLLDSSVNDSNYADTSRSVLIHYQLAYDPYYQVLICQRCDCIARG